MSEPDRLSTLIFKLKFTLANVEHNTNPKFTRISLAVLHPKALHTEWPSFSYSMAGAKSKKKVGNCKYFLLVAFSARNKTSPSSCQIIHCLETLALSHVYVLLLLMKSFCHCRNQLPKN